MLGRLKTLQSVCVETAVSAARVALSQGWVWHGPHGELAGDGGGRGWGHVRTPGGSPLTR